MLDCKIFDVSNFSIYMYVYINNYWDYFERYYLNYENIYNNTQTIVNFLSDYQNSYSSVLYIAISFISVFTALESFIPFLYENIITDTNCWLADTVYKSIVESNKINNYYSLFVTEFYISNKTAITCNSFLLAIIIFLGIVYIYFYNLATIIKVNHQTYVGSSIFLQFDEVEEEFGQTDDIISYVTLFIYFTLWFFFFNFFARFIIIKYLATLLVIFLFLITIGLITPLSVLKRAGLSCFQYVRGCGRSTLLFFEILLDFVSVTVMIIRFFVQNIRFVFIFVGVFEYYEFITQQMDPFFNSFNLNIEKNLNIFNIFGLFKILSSFFLYIYYIGHLTIVYITQLSIYFILSFWIFFFLYTTFISTRKVNYFSKL